MTTIKQYDYVVYIGRFQPFHNGHKAVIDQALKLARKQVIVCIGSGYGPRNIKNPFTVSERREIIRGIYGHAPIQMVTLADYKYNDQQWITEVQRRVQDFTSKGGWTDLPPTVALIGYDKDHTTDYLKWFPQWELVDIKYEEDLQGLNATKIRELLFGQQFGIKYVSGAVPEATVKFLEQSITQYWWKELVAEYNFIADYKKQWSASPYAPTFVTVDAVVVQDGHILMVKRKANPGKGQWALPGGFLNQNERIADAVIRELREETKLKVPDPVLRGSVVCKDVFDHPDRSLRGRTITHATLFKLASMGKLPPVKGSDDAELAKWIPISQLDEGEIYEDHYAIIQTMLGKL